MKVKDPRIIPEAAKESVQESADAFEDKEASSQPTPCKHAVISDRSHDLPTKHEN